MSEDPVPAALRFAAILDGLGLTWWLGGSLASSIHGEPRSTHDVDFVVDLAEERCDALVRAVQESFFVDADFVRQAARRRDSFQIVEKDGYNRIDVFVRKDDPFSLEQQRRRERHVIDAEGNAAVWVTSAEDIVVQKLVWYRKGDEVSDRQWRDVLGVLKANPGLDRDYLERWARETGVADLLARACGEAGIG